MGRRAGKSTTAAVRSIIEIMKPYKRVWIVAPTYQLSEKIYRVVYDFTTRCLGEFVAGRPKNSKNEMSLKMVTGSELVCKSADDPNSLVGESLDLALIDEAAIVKDLAIDYLRPALNDIDPMTGVAKGKMIAVSTPREYNWLKTMYDQGLDTDEKQIDIYGGQVLYKSYHASSFSNPHIDHESILAEKKRMPESLWNQEFMAQYQSEGGQVFPVKHRHFYPAGFRGLKKAEYTYIGIDIGRSHDFTVIFAINGRFEQVGYRRLNKVDWREIKDIIKAEIERYSSNGPVVCCVDATGGSVGDPICAELKSYFDYNFYVNIVPVSFTGNSNIKSNIIEDLKLAISDDLIKFWDIPEIYEEFVEYGYSVDNHGKISYHGPAKKHDDIVTAAGLALYATKRINPDMILIRTVA
jgi:hypothetical protein